jgi:hypothetical protein
MNKENENNERNERMKGMKGMKIIKKMKNGVQKSRGRNENIYNDWRGCVGFYLQ